MARARIIANVTNVTPDSRAYQFSVRNATVNIYERGTTDEPTIYTTEAGGTTVIGPFTTDSAGRVIHDDSSELWVEAQALDLDISGVADPVPYEAVSALDLGGRERDRATIDSGDATSAVTYPSWADVAGLTLTVDGSSRPLRLIFDCAEVNNTVTQIKSLVAIREGSDVLKLASVTNPTANNGSPCHIEHVLDSFEGSRTFKISLTRAVATGFAVVAAGATYPALFQAVEC